MQKALIAMGAAILLAAAVFAIVHFSAPREQVALEQKQRDWVPVATSELSHRLHIAGSFGAWSLLCRDSEPGTNLPGASQTPQTGRRCAVALVMRNSSAKYKLLHVRLQNSFSGEGEEMVLVYRRNEHDGRATMAPGMPGLQVEGLPVEVKADGATLTMVLHCVRGICGAMRKLTPSDVHSILSAHLLAILISDAKPAKGDSVIVPTEGLKAAFAALRRQTS